MKRLSWIISIPLLLIGVVFAVVNRQNVDVLIWPFGIELQAPLFLVILLALFLGFLIGGLLVWVSTQATQRRQKRQQNEKLRALERQIEDLRRGRESPPPTSSRLPSSQAGGR